MNRVEDVIIKPLLSEKSWRLQDERKYTFQINPKANKIQVRKAVEQLFKVKVVSVHTMSMYGKPRKTRFYQTGRQPDWKKAVVQLAPGQRIDMHQ